MMSPCGWQNPFEGNNVECQFQHASFLPFDAGVPSSDPTELLERKKEGLKYVGCDATWH